MRRSMQRRQTLAELTEDYIELKKKAQLDAKNALVAGLICKLASCSAQFLQKSCRKIVLTSRVPNKEYIAFSQKSRKLSRPINSDLFDFNSLRYLQKFAAGSLWKVPQSDRSRLLYTIPLCFLSAIDILKDGDQKSPATFFECYIGHLLSRAFGVNPRTQVEVLHLEEEASTLPTDFIFDLGPGKQKFHVPVKISTRERVIQVFAHQRVLDGVHGFGAFRCLLVCLTETKLDHEKREVIEICLPKQWVLYQRFIAAVHRFYYFDLPVRYKELATAHPPLPVKLFSQFFDEVDEIAKV